MKFAHLADLHIGIMLNHANMIEEQKYIFSRILAILKEEKPDAVLIAGDVYDRAVPSAEAASLLGWFLSALNEGGFPVFMIAGNHDSPERLAYAAALLEKQNIHIAGSFTGKMPCYTLHDEYGEADLWLLPFIRPSHVNRWISEEKDRVHDYTAAVKAAVAASGVDFSRRNVIVSHQFVSGASVHENGSEQLSVGGLDQVMTAAYEGFDYAALGHIHSFQKTGGGKICYSGTPLPYSFSEENDHKGVVIAELGRKGELVIRQRLLTPLHRMRTCRGKYEDLMLAAPQDPGRDDWLRIILTDEQEPDQAVRHLRSVYPNLLRLDYDNSRTRRELQPEETEQDILSPLEIFEHFFTLRNGRKMNETEQEIAAEMTARIFDGEEQA